jgi:hypothetical protein
MYGKRQMFPSPTATPIIGCPNGDVGALPPVTVQPGWFVVNCTLDLADASPSDNLCLTVGGMCTLRAAFQQAESASGLNTIVLPEGVFELQRLANYAESCCFGTWVASGISMINGGDLSGGAGQTRPLSTARTQPVDAKRACPHRAIPKSGRRQRSWHRCPARRRHFRDGKMQGVVFYQKAGSTNLNT